MKAVRYSFDQQFLRIFAKCCGFSSHTVRFGCMRNTSTMTDQDYSKTPEGQQSEALKKSNMKGLYKTPAVKTPTLSELADIAKDHNMEINPTDLEGYQKEIAGTFAMLTRLDRLAEPTLPVKYPRTPGYRPSPEENLHNAWYWKTHIEGANDGSLLGKKIAVKDTVMVAGVPMMNGCRALEGYTADTDATVVTRILDAGGVIAGKATCENLCFGGSSHTTAKGPVTNCFDDTRIAGGSSSGSGVLVASGEVDMALGGDQGGSIRIPASWLGIVGLKPTYGLVPYTGIVGLDPSIDHIGPMAKTVDDCASLLEVLAGYDDGLDPRQPTNINVPHYSKEISVSRLDGLKIGILREGFGHPGIDPEVSELIRAQIQNSSHAGSAIVDVSVPLHTESSAIWCGMGYKGFYDTMMSGGGHLIGFNGYYPTSLIATAGMAFRNQTNDLDHNVKVGILSGAYLANHYYGKYYAKAQNLRRLLRDSYNKALEKCDVIVMPTLPFTAPKIPSTGCSVQEYRNPSVNMSANTMAANLTGHPALSINAGFIDGLPVGLQIVGKHFDEVTVLKVAKVFENMTN